MFVFGKEGILFERAVLLIVYLVLTCEYRYGVLLPGQFPLFFRVTSILKFFDVSRRIYIYIYDLYLLRFGLNVDCYCGYSRWAVA